MLYGITAIELKTKRYIAGYMSMGLKDEVVSEQFLVIRTHIKNP